jgi:oxidase EvaA
MKKKIRTNCIFLESLLNEPDTKVITKALSILKKLKSNKKISVIEVTIDNLEKWKINPFSKNLQHNSKRFFSVCAIRYNMDSKSKIQPIINQKERGILGVICQKHKGILKFLLQAKFEPGNKNFFQLSPTIQATKSNLQRVHGGKPQRYYKYFLNKNSIIHSSVLLSEQGTKFYNKKNLNTLIEVPENKIVPIYSEFIWLSLSEIKYLMTKNNIINMSARSVLSTINFNSTFSSNFFNLNFLILTKKDRDNIAYIKNKNILNNSTNEMASLVNLSKAPWYDNRKNKNSIYNNFFIKGLKIKSNTREIKSWDQPIIKHIKNTTYILLIKEIEGRYYFLLDLKYEPGIIKNKIFTSTFSYYKIKQNTKIVKNLIKKYNGKIIHRSIQSEEGGRFFLGQNEFVIIKISGEKIDKISKRYWLSIPQIILLIRTSDLIGIQVRTFISLINYAKLK